MKNVLREYSDAVAESQHNARLFERKAFETGVGLLKGAKGQGFATLEIRSALEYVERLWMILMEDIAKPDNQLADELKARLISIGIWVLKEIVAIRMGMTHSLEDLIEINEIVAAGL